MPRQVPDTGSQFQHLRSNERLNHLGHPLVEAGSMRQGIQNTGALIEVDVARNPIADDDEQGLHCIPEPDFFSLIVSSTVVADRDFVDPRLPLRRFNRDYRLYSKTVASQRNGFEKSRAEGLITGFHVCQVKIGCHVAERSEHAICERVPKIEDSAPPGALKSGSVNDIGLSFQ